MKLHQVKRWNGWGDKSKNYPLPETALGFLKEHIGSGLKLADATLEEVTGGIPESCLPAHPLVSVEPLDRLCHARGQSLPDWIALRSGRLGQFPDGVSYPHSPEEVKSLIKYGLDSGATLIPYGGGTSVVGHINPPQDYDGPTLTIDLSNLNRLEEFDQKSQLATFGAGVRGPDLEKQLNDLGFTLGHFPQSFEFSTLGGWIATRSTGQQSIYYGRIEDLFAGGEIESPGGSMVIQPVPASAAGPDLRQLILGSEGRFGIVTRATVRIRPLPEREGFFAIIFHNWTDGIEAVRTIVQANIPVSMLRLSDALETETTLALSGRDREVAWIDRGLRLFRYGPERCLLLFGVTGDRSLTKQVRSQVGAIARHYGGFALGSAMGSAWRKSRFLSPYLRNTLWESGYALDTLETAVRWSDVLKMAAAIKTTLRNGLNGIDERVLVFSHLSHMYPDGASIYVTYLFRRDADPMETHRRWQGLKSAASQVIINHGGTISHQHGVGRDHRPYLTAEKGEIGLALLDSLSRTVDPLGVMNSGALFSAEKRDALK